MTFNFDKFRLSDWVMAIGTLIGAVFTGTAVLISAVQISNQLFYNERQQHYQTMMQINDQIRDRVAEDDALRCVVNRFDVLGADVCHEQIYNDAITIDTALSHAQLILQYQNNIYRYNLRYCQPERSMLGGRRNAECISQATWVSLIQADSNHLFAAVLQQFPYLNTWYDVRTNESEEILTAEQIEAGAGRFRDAARARRDGLTTSSQHRPAAP